MTGNHARLAQSAQTDVIILSVQAFSISSSRRAPAPKISIHGPQLVNATDGCSAIASVTKKWQVAINMVSERLYHNNLGELNKPRVTLLQGDIVEGFTTR